MIRKRAFSAEKVQFRGSGPISISARADGFVGFKDVDLTDVEQLNLIASASARSGAVGGSIEVRTGGPEGALVGEVVIELSTGGGWRRRAEPKALSLGGASGVQDLYFVFKNESARPIDPLFSFSRIEFVKEAN